MRIRNKVIAICGNGGCGKDTAAAYLGSITNLRYVESTSRVAAVEVFKCMNALGICSYQNAEDAHRDRRNHREVWAKMIDLYNYEDPARLYKKCLEDQDILTGVRKRREYEACLAGGLIDFSIWIERAGFDDDSTQEYGPSLCDIVIYNNQCVKALETRLRKIADMFGIISLPPATDL